MYRWSAEQILGVPNVDRYGDDGNAWAQARGRGEQEEYLHVSMDLIQVFRLITCSQVIRSTSVDS